MSLAAFIAAQRAEHGVSHAVACRALGVSQAWFYKWRARGLSARAGRRQRLDAAVAAIFRQRDGRDGSPRITVRLRQAGWRVSENTVAASMRRQALAARPKRRRRNTTRPGRGRRHAPDRLGRNFTAMAPDMHWCADGTEIPTGEGKLYLAAVSDLFSRRILGYAMSTHHDAALAVASLQMAVAGRGGVVGGVVLHSDQGSEYTAGHFRAACERMGVVQSMGRVGSALDNAAAESLFSSLEFELFRILGPFDTREQARRMVAVWVDDFNTMRLHSANGMCCPVEYEQQRAATRTKREAA
ncbi:IS3 family transposase [Streptosporangium sp. NPDC049248]|uniref:IS3 family transposase n=1 Tax=Streptosporangium sp. NPDC049248 TaxID=3155651 RepID=UPI0034345E1D